MMLPCRSLRLSFALTVLLIGNRAFATEPNETFVQATILPAGVFSVDDDLVAGGGSFPDTVVASLNSIGFITDFNDDGGPWEGSLGSGLTNIPINNDSSLWFLVTGNPDFNFVGDHFESGDYHVYIDIYNDFGGYEETIEFDETLQQSEVDQFYLDGFDPFYTYDVFIDNTVGASSPADVDFFIFTGLAPGASFSAEITQEVLTGFDSLLGWFNDTGSLIEIDDDDGAENLSLIENIVPASGQLVLAVTGFGDDLFSGAHNENAMYSLEVTLDSASTPGDYNGDGRVDAGDYVGWRNHLGDPDESALNSNGDGGNVSLDDYTWWKQYYGTPGSGSGDLSSISSSTVPEPSATLLWVLAVILVLRFKLRR